MNIFLFAKISYSKFHFELFFDKIIVNYIKIYFQIANFISRTKRLKKVIKKQKKWRKKYER